jgi:hypothetical protein
MLDLIENQSLNNNNNTIISNLTSTTSSNSHSKILKGENPTFKQCNL